MKESKNFYYHVNLKGDTFQVVKFLQFFSINFSMPIKVEIATLLNEVQLIFVREEFASRFIQKAKEIGMAVDIAKEAA